MIIILTFVSDSTIIPDLLESVVIPKPIPSVGYVEPDAPKLAPTLFPKCAALKSNPAS